MDDLYICWDFFDSSPKVFAPVKGDMTIHLDKFFPCPLVKFKKLLKVIEMDFSHEEELKAKLKVYFQNRISVLEVGMSASKKKGNLSDVECYAKQIKQFERYLQFV